MRKKTIAFADHAQQLGGAQKSLMELLAHLDTDRYEPLLLCAREAEWTERPELAKVARHYVFSPAAVFSERRDDLSSSLLGSARKLSGALQPVWELSSACRRLRADLLHTNTLKAHMLGAVAARAAGVPLIWHVRDILEPGPARGWLRRAAAWARPEIIAISQAVVDQFEGVRVPISVIYNGVPLDRFQPRPASAQLREELGLEPDHEVACIVGRLTPWKGHRTLLQAMAQVAAVRPQARLVVVGEVAFWESDYEGELKALAADLAIAERVVWTGFRDDIPDLLALCDVFVLPSENEPFGRAIIEAMAMARPVVGTRSGGVPEIIVDGETGLLVDVGDVQALARALLSLLEDADLRVRMGQAAAVRAREAYDVRRVAAMVQDVYGRTLCD